jgi:hypothetical protein
MGRRTYEFVGGAIEGMATYVFSRTLPPGPRNGVTVLGDDGTARLADMRAESGRERPVISGNTARVKLRLASCETSPGGGLSLKYTVGVRGLDEAQR